jgi:hypothetical protein
LVPWIVFPSQEFLSPAFIMKVVVCKLQAKLRQYWDIVQSAHLNGKVLSNILLT